MAAASSPPGLLDALRAEGFTLTIAAGPGGATLRVGPATRLSAAQRAAIRTHKAALLELLRREAAEAAARLRAPHDPRPDLDATQRDAVWWSVLLALAAEAHGEGDPRGVYGALRGVRCLGAGLGRTPGGALRIVAGSVPAGEWRAVRGAWLVPHRPAVLELLRAVARAWRTRAAELAGVAETLREVRRVWPEARALSDPEVEALDALPAVDHRVFLAVGLAPLSGTSGGLPGAESATPGGGRP
jgi:hypothetical protein